MMLWSGAWPRPPEAGIRGRHRRSDLLSEARAGIAAAPPRPCRHTRSSQTSVRMHFANGFIRKDAPPPPAALAPSLRRRPARTATRPSMPGVRHRRYGRRPASVFPDTSDRHYTYSCQNSDRDGWDCNLGFLPPACRSYVHNSPSFPIISQCCLCHDAWHSAGCMLGGGIAVMQQLRRLQGAATARVSGYARWIMSRKPMNSSGSVLSVGIASNTSSPTAPVKPKVN